MQDTDSTDGLSDNRVVVSEIGDGKFTNRVTVGRHEMLADEPVGDGGDDLGPGPYQYLMAGLGACTSMTLRMYADRKGIPLERVKVSLEHSRIHAKDCEDCDAREGYLDRIDKTIELTGELDDAQRTRLMEIADRCPVHRTLQSEIVIRSKQVSVG